MKSKELAMLNKEELNARLAELRKELVKLRTQIASGTAPKSPGQVRNIRKNIARIMTYLHKKEVTPK